MDTLEKLEAPLRPSCMMMTREKPTDLLIVLFKHKDRIMLAKICGLGDWWGGKDLLVVKGLKTLKKTCNFGENLITSQSNLS